MSIKFGSEEANGILATDKLIEKVRAMSGPRLEETKKELVDLQDEIEFFEHTLGDLRSRKNALNREQTRLEKGEPG